VSISLFTGIRGITTVKNSIFVPHILLEAIYMEARYGFKQRCKGRNALRREACPNELTELDIAREAAAEEAAFKSVGDACRDDGRCFDIEPPGKVTRVSEALESAGRVGRTRTAFYVRGRRPRA
jgi:hypothetical protein